MILICVAVRLKSSRCPKKALADLYGEPLIVRLTERVALSGYKIVWCTSTHPQDNPLSQLARWHDIDCYRGDELDVMSRFIDVAKAYNASTVVRVTGDNPLTDPDLIKKMVKYHHDNESNYTYVNGPPRGTKPEIISVHSLKVLHATLLNPEESEYMTPMLQRLRKSTELTLKGVACDPNMRLTVDTPKDLARVRKIYEHFKGNPPPLAELVPWVKDNLTDYYATGETESSRK